MFEKLNKDELNRAFMTMCDAIYDIFQNGWTPQANEIADEFREIRNEIRDTFQRKYEFA